MGNLLSKKVSMKKMKKKIINLLLLGAFCIILSGCGKEPTKIELTADNFENYFNISAQVTDFRTEDKRTILGTDHYGYANLKITVNPKKNISTEDILIKGKVTYSGICWASNTDYFDVSINIDGKGETSKSITTGQCPLLTPDNPGISSFYTYELKDNEFFIQDKKFVIYSISGSVYE